MPTETIVSRASKGLYLVGPRDGASTYVDAPSKAEALIQYWRARWERAAEAAKAKAEQDRQIAGLVGQAIREGSIEVEAHASTQSYIDAARALGFEAQSHSRDGRKWLLVARDVRGLNALKGGIDRQQQNSPAR